MTKEKLSDYVDRQIEAMKKMIDWEKKEAYRCEENRFNEGQLYCLERIKELFC